MREAGEAFAVRWVRIVEAWVTCFNGFEAAVEPLRFDADFGDEMFGKVGSEIWRVGGGWVWKYVVVNEAGDAMLAPHCDLILREDETVKTGEIVGAARARKAVAASGSKERSLLGAELFKSTLGFRLQKIILRQV